LIDVLSHRTGLEDEGSLYCGPNGQPLYHDTATVINVVNHLSTSDDGFRESWAYSPLLYALVTVLIEEMSEQPLSKFLSSKLFQPLGMDSTSLVGSATHDDTASRTYAKPYAATKDHHYVERRVENAAYGFPNDASMGIQSSVRDMGRWAQQMNNAYRHTYGLSSVTRLTPGDILPEMDTILKPWCTLPPCAGGSAAYCLGWFLCDGYYISDDMFDLGEEDELLWPCTLPKVKADTTPQKILYHSGTGAGFTSSLHSFPEHGDAVIVLGNSSFSGDAVDCISKLLTSTICEYDLDVDELSRNLEFYTELETGRWSHLHRDLKEERQNRQRGSIPKVSEISGTFINKERGLIISVRPCVTSDEEKCIDLGPYLDAGVRFGDVPTLELALWYFCDDTICFLPSETNFQRWGMCYLEHWSEFLLHLHHEAEEDKITGLWWQYTHKKDAIWFERLEDDST
jgi:CubicO group peptidase (beta-lactamase class C family)